MSNDSIRSMKAPEIKKLFEETVNNINQINDALSKIEADKQDVLKIVHEISGEGPNKGIIGEIKIKQAEVDEMLQSIREAHAELFGDDEDESDSGLKGDLESLQKEFNITQEKIKSAERELNGYDIKNKSGEDSHIEGLKEKIINFFDIQKKKYDDIYNKIENELLAGATTVGLSKAYDDKANTYDKPNKWWLAGFFTSIGLIIVFLFTSLEDIDKYFNSESSLSTGKILTYFIVKLLIRIGIITSLFWAASFTVKRYSQNKRLSEEYSFKATFAKSFEGYKKRAEELDQSGEDHGLSEKLLNNMIEMTAFNPVETMESKSHKEDHPTATIIEKSIDTIAGAVKIIDKKI